MTARDKGQSTMDTINTEQLSKQLQTVGLQSRPFQMQMITDIQQAITAKKIIGIEAPTGTGKTLAYLLGSLAAKPADQSIVVSTATIALQEQLMEKDLPLVEKILKKKINYALAKGRRRYVCHARVYEGAWQDDMLQADEDVSGKLQNSLEREDWDGDIDSLSFSIDAEQWRRVSTDRDGCAGKSCQYYEDCAFFKARKKMYVADIVVVNHSLLLSDFSMGGGVVLPEPGDCVYVVDECHHLAGKALDHFSHHAGVMSVVDWVNGVNRYEKDMREHKLLSEAPLEMLVQLGKEAVTIATQIRDWLSLNDDKFNDDKFNDDIWRVTDLPNELEDLAKSLHQTCDQVVNYLTAAVDCAQAKLTGQGVETDVKSELVRISAGLGVALSRAINHTDTWRAFTSEHQPKQAPLAKWFSESDGGFQCHVAPIYVGDVLQKQVWDRFTNGAVLCSATMSALGSLDYFSRRTGLKQYSRYEAMQIPSQFDFDKSLLYVPAMKFEPSGASMIKHEQEVVDLLPSLIMDKGGTLVLFTSRKAMMATYDALEDELRQDVILQKSQSKARLVAEHKRRIRNWQRSILFGMASFGEGLDLPADFCRHVIIHKLPFSVPSTPTELTRSEWLQANQLNPFMMATLPQASIQLTQYVGRLIRQDDDTGIVTILDKRLYTKQYGSQLLANLPAFHRLINVDLTEFEQSAKSMGLVTSE